MPSDLAERIPSPCYTAVIVLACSGVMLSGVTASRAGLHPALVATIVVITCAPFILRRRYPLGVLGFELVVFIATSRLGIPLAATAAPVLLALYALARWRRRIVSLIAMTVTAMVLFIVAYTTESANWWEPKALIFVVWTGLFAAVGVAVQTHRSFIAAMEDRARRAEEAVELESARRVAEERLRISRDLHDTLAHDIAVINIHAGLAHAALRRDPEVAEESLRTIQTSAQDVLAEIGGLLTVLRTDSPETGSGSGGSGGAHGGTDPIIGVSNIDDLVAKMRATGMEIRVERVGATRPLPALIDTTVYRVIQESLTNAHKHGNGTEAKVRIVQDNGQITIEISNSFDPHAESVTPIEPSLRSGLGLVGIRERVTMVGGTVEVEAPTEAHGTTESGGSGWRKGGATTGVSAEFLVRAIIPLKRAEPLKGPDTCQFE